ncbi:MAG: hypothetical protein OJF55_000933 [Rhodanobacteraceae bacterium]|jgi:hypothetical protein|nr:MAG: hypothetical protein OJF55_000933 [Rhodanobacteraceae bacterium]
MNTRHALRLSLAGAIALALLGGASIGIAQTPPPPPPPAASTPTPPPPPPANPAPPAQPATPMAAPQQPATPPQDASGQFYQGTETSATYPLPDSHGGTLTVNAGMPAHVQSYGPPPSFQSLDTNHDGRISESEAQAYPPLDSDFLYASGGGNSISRAQYEKWVQNQH